MLMVAQPTGLHHSLEGLERPGDGLTYLQFSGGNCNEVHVVQIGHVNNPHLLVAVLLGLGKLAEQRRLRSWKVASDCTGGTDLSCHTGPWTQYSLDMEPYLSTKNRALAKLLQAVPSSVKWA